MAEEGGGHVPVHRLAEALEAFESQIHRNGRLLVAQNALMILLVLTMIGLVIAIGIFTRAVIGEY